jgi:hypothetical protein
MNTIKDALNDVNAIADIISSYKSYEFDIPVLAMVIEEIAKSRNMPLLDLYEVLVASATEVIEEYGDVV